MNDYENVLNFLNENKVNLFKDLQKEKVIAIVGPLTIFKHKSFDVIHFEMYDKFTDKKHTVCRMTKGCNLRWLGEACLKDTLKQQVNNYLDVVRLNGRLAQQLKTKAVKNKTVKI